MIPGSDQDYIYLTPPATAKLDPGDENSYGSPDAAWDLEYAPSADGQQWFVQTGVAITDLKAEPPSFSACQQALDGNAMNLETQDIIQGHGYCLTAQNGDTAYVFIDSLPPLDGGDSGPFTISVTLWQDN
jgi:hypothetical protein